MYIFVFLWTPVMNQSGSNPPLGMIFSAFMMCIMVGSSIFSSKIEGIIKFTSSFGATNLNEF